MSSVCRFLLSGITNNLGPILIMYGPVVTYQVTGPILIHDNCHGNGRESVRKTMGTAVAPWKQLLFGAIEANSHLNHSSYVQLATIGINGRPSNRTVVFRGFEENSDRIQINTDARSRKIQELKQCPFSEMCWYFSGTWEQFRINGRIEVIDAYNPDQTKLQLREKAWFANSLKSRLMYVCPTPGSPYNSEQLNQEVKLDPSSGPVADYCLMLLEPEKVDYLNLKSNQRILFSSMISGTGEKCWTSEKVNP